MPADVLHIDYIHYDFWQYIGYTVGDNDAEATHSHQLLCYVACGGRLDGGDIRDAAGGPSILVW